MLKLRITGANLDADVAAAARAALEAAAARLAAQVRQDLATPPGGPHDKPWRQTGALQASIGHVVEGDTATVGSTSPYAAAQEHGTRTVPPRPFLLPAAKRLAPDLARDIGRAVHAALAGEGADAPFSDPDTIIRPRNSDAPAPELQNQPGNRYAKLAAQAANTPRTSASIHLTAGTKHRLTPHPDSTGPHSTFRRDPTTGVIQNYETYEYNERTGKFSPILRFRGQGKPHNKVPTPYVLELKEGKGLGNQPSAARPALSSEIPRGPRGSGGGGGIGPFDLLKTPGRHIPRS